jgi:hypothetical protein
MRNALKALILIGAATAIAGCHRTQSATTNNDAMSIEDDNLTTNQSVDNSQVETLPPDESSGTSSRELANGQDNPDVNDLGNGD